MLRCSDDDSFGPVLGPGSECASFDFTLLFEEAFFTIVPCVVLFIVALPAIWSSWRKSRVVEWRLLRAIKLALYPIVIVLQIALVALWGSDATARTRLTLAAGLLSVLSTLTLFVLSILEHSRDIKPSAIIQTFLLMTALLDVARVRTEWFMVDGITVASLFTATFALRLLILAVESVPKVPYILVDVSDQCPREYSGIFGRSLMTWVLPLFRDGYKRNLSLEELFPVEHSLRGNRLADQLQAVWSKEDQSKKHTLFYATFKAFLPQLYVLAIPRMALVGFSIAQPFLVRAALLYIQGSEAEPASHGYGLIGAYAIVYLGIALSRVWYSQLAFSLATMIRGALVSAIYQGMLSLRAESDKASAGQALMSNDVDRITVATSWLVSTVPSIIHVGLALGILGVQLGAVCIAPVIVAILCTLAGGRIGRRIPPRQRRWMQAIQKRVGVTTEIFGAIKGVKMTGLTEQVSKEIQGLREFELEESKRFRRAQISNILIGQTPSILTPAVTFTAFAIAQKVSGGSEFDVAKAFTSLSLLSLLIQPVSELIMIPTNLGSALACFDRIQEFLTQEKRQDPRVLQEAGPSGPGLAHPKPLLKVQDASFGWSKEKTILTDISVEIQPATLTMVVGPVGSGKSTLLNALLGETYMPAGAIETTTYQVAFCEQDPWILNRTIRENIVGFGVFQRALYDKVVQACQLQKDLDALPDGDNSLVGSKGIALSGGQKQRIALARAAYSGNQLAILDDSLKGLDARTASNCFSALLGPRGLLRTGDKAVVLATHNINWLPSADQIIVLGADGKIGQSGTFEELRAVDGYVKNLALESTTPESDTESLEKAPDRTDRSQERTKGDLPQNRSAPQPSTGRGDASKGAMWFYLKSMGLGSLILFLSLVITQIACRALQPLWLNLWVSASDAFERLGMWVGVYLVFGLSVILFLGLEIWFYLVVIVPRSAISLHWNLMMAAMRAPLSYFVKTDTGEIINRFSQDLTLVDLPLPIAFMLASESLTLAVSEVILTSISSGYLACAIPLLSGLLYIIQRVYLKTSRQMRLLDLEAKSPLYSNFISSFSGLVTIRAFGWSTSLNQENMESLDMSQRPFFLLYCLQNWLALVLDLTVAGLAVLLVALTVALKDKVNTGLLGVALTSVLGLGGTLGTVIQNWTQLETSLGAVARIRDFERTTPSEIEPRHGPPSPSQDASGGVWPHAGGISVSHISTAYDDRTILQDLNLEIHPGEKVAICGRTGSGKSTLLAVVLSLQLPTSGNILIDGVDTASVELNTLRSSIVSIPQDPIFLSGSVRRNLDLFGVAGDADIWNALEKVGIKALIEEKGGIDADLNTDWLSAGQKQLFCLARAMLRTGKVLLLDEATSSLDFETEKMVMNLINTEFQGWTMLVIAHHLKTIGDFDKVLVLEGGKVAEYDQPRKLLQRESLFKSLWDLQES
ncbi:P-loop containing nucleoside triphosphate hydrolase protein [Thozetella sp. PMI_491]|nr:P-loop containing nucleoside triphosphate hydrolase protein [Thozetella sp. PMI_491]